MSDRGPQSGRDLKLTLRGMLESIERGDDAALVNLKHLLNALTGPDRAKWEERCPEAVLRIRMALLKLGSEEERDGVRIQIAQSKLDLDRERQSGEGALLDREQRHVHLVIPPDPVRCTRDECGWRGHRREAPDGVCPSDGGALADG